jgi:large conductance mechanosensitive channel
MTDPRIEHLRRRAMGLAQEFRDFAVKGNALDMAVGIIIGAAFNKIVTSLVSDIIMPPIGMLLGGVDFKNLELVLKQAGTSATGETIPAVAVRYGLFVNTCIDFLIVAFTVFMMVKMVNRLSRMRLNSVPLNLIATKG